MLRYCCPWIRRGRKGRESWPVNTPGVADAFALSIRLNDRNCEPAEADGFEHKRNADFVQEIVLREGQLSR